LYINIHSHQLPANNEWVIQNRYQHFDNLLAGSQYSIGLHPWYIDAASWLQQMEALTLYSTNNNVLAIGECGLDKVCTTDFIVQQQVFIRQIALANTIGKPLLIHCVRAFDEVQLLLEKNKVQVPVIFHGFNKSRALAQQLAGKGYYISFGKALQLPAVQLVLAGLPLPQIFLETDAAALSIAGVYALAASALQIDITALSLQIAKNTATVFGNTILPV